MTPNPLSLLTRVRPAALVTLVWAICTASGALHAQPSTPCRAGQPVEIEALHGIWQVKFDPAQATSASLLLERHAEHAESVQGVLKRQNPSGNDRQALLAGDLEDGELILDESEDGRRISAVWVGRLSEGSCGREITGTRREAGEDRAESFTMRRR
jgi:hypothetical protein